MALEMVASLDCTSFHPDREERCALAIELAASGTGTEERRSARTVLALDVSASMQGEPLDQVIRSVDRILDALGEPDELGIVAFAENATRVVDPVRLDASGKRLVRSRVGRLFAENRTNIQAGLELAVAMLEGTPDAMRRGVVLLSDGAPNVGAHTAEALRDVVRGMRSRGPQRTLGPSVFSLGYGVDHCEDVLATIGEAGGGGYEFVQDPAACARAFARALGAQGDVVASGIEVVISPAEGVEVARFVGHEDNRFSRGGVVVPLPDMIGGARRVVVAELLVRAPGRERFMVDVAEVLVRSSAGRASHVLSLEVADRQPLVVTSAARSVLLARAEEARDASRTLADRGQFGAAAAALRSVMTQIERLPGWIVNDGSALAEAYELLVDEAIAFERKPSAEAYATFRKTAVSSKLTSHVPSAAKSRGGASQKLIEHIAGDHPKAYLVGSAGRFSLGAECVIGRTAEAEICIASPQVSRRHAEIYADAGAYWITDLGSTNPTLVNGVPLGRAPHRFAPGDLVCVGGVELRYEEG